MGVRTDTHHETEAGVVDGWVTTTLASVSRKVGQRQLGNQISMFQVDCEIG
jgi:hypothetical protein